MLEGLDRRSHLLIMENLICFWTVEKEPIDPPEVTAGFSNVTVYRHDNVTLSCRVRNVRYKSAASIDWRFQNETMRENWRRFKTWSGKTEDGTPKDLKYINLEIQNVTEADIGEYSCEAATWLGTGSDNIRLSLIPLSVGKHFDRIVVSSCWPFGVVYPISKVCTELTD